MQVPLDKTFRTAVHHSDSGGSPLACMGTLCMLWLPPTNLKHAVRLIGAYKSSIGVNGSEEALLSLYVRPVIDEPRTCLGGKPRLPRLWLQLPVAL